MDILQNLKILSIPGWLKVLLILLLTVLGAVNAALFVLGVLDHSREGWVKASIELMSVVLPIFLIGLIAWGSNTGTAALQARTAEVFLHLLPDALSRVGDFPAPFRRAAVAGARRAWWSPAETPRLPPRAPGERTRVLVNLRRDECHADIILLMPGGPAGGAWKELVIRIELNVRKVNLNLCFDAARVRERLGMAEDASPAELAAALRAQLGHAVRGAAQGSQQAAGEAGPAETGHADGAPRARLSYAFNDRALVRQLGERPMVCLVASAWLADEFLWDAGERLFFAQDLVFFLRAVAREAGDLLRDIPEAAVDAEEARLTAGSA